MAIFWTITNVKIYHITIQPWCACTHIKSQNPATSNLHRWFVTVTIIRRVKKSKRTTKKRIWLTFHFTAALSASASTKKYHLYAAQQSSAQTEL